MMTFSRSVFNNTGVLVLSNIVDKGIGFIGTILLANYLGAERMGFFGSVLVISAIAARISDLGIPLGVQRNAAQQLDLSPDLFASGLAIRLLTSAGMLVFLVVYSVILKQEAPFFHALLVAGLFSTATSLAQLAFAVFLAELKMKYQAICTITFRLLYLGSILLVIFFKGGVIEVIAGMTVASAVQLILAFWILGKFFFRARITWRSAPLFHLIQDSVPIGIASMFVMAYDRIDTVILSWLVPNRDLGNYYAGYQFYLSMLILSFAFTSSMYSVLSIQAKGSITRFARTYSRALVLALVLGGGASLFLFATAEYVGTYVYAGKYESLPIVVRWLSAAVFFVYGNNLCGVTLNALRLVKVNMWIVIVGASINILLNLMLIPVVGFIVSAQITVATEAIVFMCEFVYLFYYLRSHIPEEPVKRDLA